MSHSYQIDIDSSFRDRISYPDCGNFVIPINTSFSNSNNPFTARDPVLLGFPYDTGECYEATGPYSVDLPGFILQLSSGSLNNINAYYKMNELTKWEKDHPIPNVDSVTKNDASWINYIICYSLY